MHQEGLMADVEAVRAAVAALHRAQRPVAGALGGYGLAEAYEALVTTWVEHLETLLAALGSGDGGE
jgi:hypothetical protein